MESEHSHSSNNLNPEEDIHDAKNALIYQLLIKCKKEMENDCLHKPLVDYIDRVAYYTGISRTKLHRINNQSIGEINYDIKYFDLNHRITILKCIANMYDTKNNSTYKNIYKSCNSFNTGMNYGQFLYMMNFLGYEYRKDELGQEILIEDPDLTFERYHYLKQIINLRLDFAPIYYIDEVFVDKTYTFPKPWVKNIDISSEACDGYVFFHAVSTRGCLNGFFCAPTSKTDFVKWITHILLPHLDKPSVIVMDKNYLHRSKVNVITKYHSKEEMLHYLRLNNIPCSEKLDKAELFSIITKCSIKNGTYDVDDILKSHGHKVLWLPSNFHDLTLTHFLWKYIRESKTIKLDNDSPRETKIKLLEGLMSFEHTIWENFDDELSGLEKEIFDIDIKTSKALENNFNLQSDTSC